jgi:hypothetical protein
MSEDPLWSILGATLIFHKVKLWQEKPHSSILHIVCHCGDGPYCAQDILDFPLDIAFTDDGYYIIQSIELTPCRVWTNWSHKIIDDGSCGEGSAARVNNDWQLSFFL